MNQTTTRLMVGAFVIGLLKGINVVAIEFEDGSGIKFNYKGYLDKEWKFIDLSRYDLRRHYYAITKVEQSLGATPAEIF